MTAQDNGGMQQRPLLITIFGWLYILTAPLVIAQLPFEDWEPATNGWAQLPSVVIPFKVVFAVSVFGGAVLAIRGRKLGRTMLVVALSIDLFYTFLADRLDANPFVLTDVLFVSIVAISFYGSRGNAFFVSTGKPPRMTHQLGTALWYTFVTFLLAMAAGYPAAWRMTGIQGFYFFLICLFVAAVVFAVGRAFGTVSNPRRDIGGILIFAALFSFVFSVSAFVHNAGGFAATLNGGNATPNLNLWIAGLTAAVVGGLGRALIHNAEREDEEQPINTDTTSNKPVDTPSNID